MYATSAFERPSENVSYENLLDNSSELKENSMTYTKGREVKHIITTQKGISFICSPSEMV